MMLMAIDRRLHNKFAMQASMHGIKIPIRHNSNILQVEEEDTSFDSVAIEKAMIEAQQRVKARYV